MNADMPTPESETPRPASHVPGPESETPRPASRVPGPESETPRPASRVPGPESETPRPASHVPGPESETPRPASHVPGPGSDTPRPASRVPGPESETPRPASHVPGPESETPRPASRVPRPESETPRPASRVPGPESETPRPASRAPGPESDTPRPASRVPGPESAPPTLTPQPPTRLRVRAIFLLVVLLGCGAATAFRSGVTGYTRPSEAWLEDQIPARIGDFTFIPSAENPKVSFKVSDETYKKLEPIGAVVRTYTNGKETYEALLIAADHNTGVHDPRICLNNERSRLVDEHIVDVGGVEVAVDTLLREGTAPALVAFTFRGPDGYSGSHWVLWADLLRNEFKTARPQVCVFYRFIAQDPEAKEADLLRFVGEYIKATDAQLDPKTVGVR